jgi:hypothetical protein
MATARRAKGIAGLEVGRVVRTGRGRAGPLSGSSNRVPRLRRRLFAEPALAHTAPAPANGPAATLVLGCGVSSLVRLPNEAQQSLSIERDAALFDVQHRATREELSDPGNDLAATQAGQVGVNEDEVERRVNPAERGEVRLPVRRNERVITRVVKETCHERCDGLIVVDDEDARARWGSAQAGQSYEDTG